MIYLGADHRGYELKEKIAKWLFEWKYKFMDMGAQNLDPNDDYTKYAELVGSIVGSHYAEASRDKKEKVFGILVCGSGVGVDATANKFDGVRASIGKNPGQVKAGRNDDDMNVLVIAADYTKDEEAREMLKTFLETKYQAIARRERRLQEIEKIEANN